MVAGQFADCLLQATINKASRLVAKTRIRIVKGLLVKVSEQKYLIKAYSFLTLHKRLGLLKEL
jgi:hypothetical protein